METGHSVALLAKHAGLEEQIALEARRPSPDTLLIARLKKRKLLVKEELIQIQ